MQGEPTVRPRVVLIHAMRAAIQPILEAFQREWHEPEVSNLLDESLVGNLQRDGALTPRIVQQICDLATHAARAGADGVLFTCSAFTPAMDVARRLLTIPVLKPDEAMIAAALETGKRIGVVASMPPSVPAAEAQLRAAAAQRKVPIEVLGVAVPNALQALNAGHLATHDQLIADAAERLTGRVDVLCLAQFSMARARPVVQSRIGVPVLTSPTAAVARLKALLTASQGA